MVVVGSWWSYAAGLSPRVARCPSGVVDSAGRAGAPVDDLGLVDVVAVVVRGVQAGALADGAVDVDDRAAGAADEVVVVVADPQLVAGGGAGRLDPADEASLGQGARGRRRPPGSRPCRGSRERRGRWCRRRHADGARAGPGPRHGASWPAAAPLAASSSGLWRHQARLNHLIWNGSRKLELSLTSRAAPPRNTPVTLRHTGIRSRGVAPYPVCRVGGVGVVRRGSERVARRRRATSAR